MRYQLNGLSTGRFLSDQTLTRTVLLVTIRSCQRVSRKRKSFLRVGMGIEQPESWRGTDVLTLFELEANMLRRLHCFLRDFGYDSQLLAEETIAESELVGLRGVIKLGKPDRRAPGAFFLDAFASATTWESPAKALGEHRPPAACRTPKPRNKAVS